MKLRTTLIVLLIGVAAWFGIEWLGPTRVTPETKPLLVPKEYVDQWDEIEMKLWSGERQKLVKEPGNAVMLRFGQESRTGDPFVYRDPADPSRVAALLGALIDSRREYLAGGGDHDVKMRVGLDPPRCYVILRAQGKPELDLGFGNDDPSGGGVLACAAGEERVFRTGGQVMSVLKSFNQVDWRSRTVFGLEPTGVTEIAITRFDPKNPDKNVYIDARRESAREWRLKQPGSKPSLMADAEACQSLAQQLSLMRVASFISQKFDKQVREATGLPDLPFLQVTVASGPTAITLDVGNYLGGNNGYAALLPLRGAETCFVLKKEEIEPLVTLTADSLRERRLYPRIENYLIGLKRTTPDGATTAWSFGRQGDSPRGRWEIRAPFHALAHEGKGSGCFAQIVADLDNKVSVEEFLDPATPFTPEMQLELVWRNEQVVDRRLLAVARSGERTLVKVLFPPRPDELFAVGGALAAILDLDPQLYRDRAIFPGDKAFAARVVHWKLTAPGGVALEARREDLKSTPQPVGGTDVKKVPTLTAAAGTLFGLPCSGYVRATSVAGEPFAKETFRLAIGTKEGEETREETLIVGSEEANVFYCRLSGRQPDEVLMLVPRERLAELLRLVQ
jgi:uncharacterized protein DUF4340